jgi:hypothetical protein
VAIDSDEPAGAKLGMGGVQNDRDSVERMNAGHVAMTLRFQRALKHNSPELDGATSGSA